MKNVLVQFVARILFLPILILSVTVFLRGYSAIGGGFSAGLLAAIGFILQMIAFGYREVYDSLHLNYAHYAALAGLLIALGAAFGPTLFGYPPSSTFPRPGGSVIEIGTLELDTAILFDFGVYLLVLGFTVTMMSLFVFSREEELEP